MWIFFSKPNQNKNQIKQDWCGGRRTGCSLHSCFDHFVSLPISHLELSSLAFNALGSKVWGKVGLAKLRKETFTSFSCFPPIQRSSGYLVCFLQMPNRQWPSRAVEGQLPTEEGAGRHQRVTLLKWLLLFIFFFKLEWIPISSSRGSSWPREWIPLSCIFCIGRQILHHWATWEAPLNCFLNFSGTSSLLFLAALPLLAPSPPPIPGVLGAVDSWPLRG